jgi:serine/threonine-protein kinase
MKGTRWQRIEELFLLAQEQPREAWRHWLIDACADAELRREVEDMLGAADPGRALAVERFVVDQSAGEGAGDPFIGIRLGPWRVIGVVGHGGMGTVYLAQRDDGRYEQRVALKLVRGSGHHPASSTRFKAEAYILGRLSHPNIARLIDAGHTPEGSAYLVMEYVDGTPITTYCDAQRLTVEGRLRLFRTVCDATQHAHQSLVVHRDLKPSNILVSSAGEVKLLDFGIAKLLEPDHPLADQTMPGMRALTPAYAAPEQIRGEPVATPADVYVLGVVLHELLTGQRHAGDVSGAGPAVDSPESRPAPSLAVGRRLAAGDDGARTAMAEVAAARRTSPARLVRRLSGDIDRIVQKAMQPEPGRRYGSAGQLADDLQRLLDGRPVVAQPDSVAYRARRFVGRHRVGMTMAAVLCALTLSFAIVAAMQARAVRAERDRAQLEAGRAERVAFLVTDLFKLAEPAVGRGDTITARELLDRGSRRIAMELEGDPDTQAALFHALARVYGNLGLHDAAIGVLGRALALEPTSGGGGTLARAETLHLLAERHASKNDYPAAAREYREALDLRRRLKAPGADVAATLEGLGRTLNATARFAEARALLEDAVAIRRADPGSSRSDLMSGLYELGLLVHFGGDAARAERLFREGVEAGRGIAGPSPAKVTSLVRQAEVVAEFDHAPAKAEPLLREALAMARTIYAGDHQQIASCLGELARNLLQLGRLAEAEAAAREGTAMAHRLFGDRHNDTLLARQALARVLRAERKTDEAERILREVLPLSRSLLGEGNPRTISTARTLASVLEEQGRFREAFDLRRDELDRTIKVLGEHDVFVAIGLAGLGRNALSTGQLDLAETYLTQALEVRRKIHPPDHWRIDEARGLVGAARLRAGRLREAETDLLAAYEGLRAHRGSTAAETESVRARLVELYDRWDRPDQARRYRSDPR